MNYKAGVLKLFEPLGTFQILTWHGRHYDKMPATKCLPQKMEPATNDYHSKDPCTMTIAATCTANQIFNN